MKKIYLLAVFVIGASLASTAQVQLPVSDSLNPFTDKEILKLSTLIYELEKKDSLARATEPNGFGLKSASTIADKTLLKDFNDDSIHYYTGIEAIKLSDYIYELERRDSIRMAAIAASVAAADSAGYELEEGEAVQYFETTIYFNFDSYVIRQNSYKSLDDVAEILKKYENIDFVIEGYCDNVGGSTYNKRLSLKRSGATRDYFVEKKGITEPRIVTVTGFGADKFAASNNTKSGRAKNRRVVVKAVK